MAEWECRDINSCLNCPYPDCIRPTSFDYPPRNVDINGRPRKKRGGKSRIPVDVVDVNTGSCQRFGSLTAAAAFVGISFDRARYSMKTGKSYRGYVIRRV